MRKLASVLPHVSIILSGLFIIFYFIDRVNSAMNYINNDISKSLLLALCIVSIVVACMQVHVNRNRYRN